MSFRSSIHYFWRQCPGFSGEKKPLSPRCSLFTFVYCVSFNWYLWFVGGINWPGSTKVGKLISVLNAIKAPAVEWVHSRDTNLRDEDPEIHCIYLSTRLAYWSYSSIIRAQNYPHNSLSFQTRGWLFVCVVRCSLKVCVCVVCLLNQGKEECGINYEPVQSWLGSDI